MTTSSDAPKTEQRTSPTPDPGSDILRALLGLWQAAFDNHDAEAIAALFAPDVLFQGLTPPLRSGRDAVLDYYRNVPPGTTVLISNIEAISLTPEIVSGHAQVTFIEADRRQRPVCLSITAQNSTGQWQIKSYHASGVA
ncbi:MAG TPA: SgcJ/EcaC family oxidoreductase [Pusillimonas sp.]|uniref:YybH family protein n=1 Tax=unclassified Pusillimonas TaxID=2640016 RepID=UPI0026027257|nr:MULTISPECIES: SgcJ/EcaC family oxidoreductase [unclassified Pusillimonas]HLU19260.1 SgcJ/EcaC family oxidoreductase [Pusillimonas sp.]